MEPVRCEGYQRLEYRVTNSDGSSARIVCLVSEGPLIQSLYFVVCKMQH